MCHIRFFIFIILFQVSVFLMEFYYNENINIKKVNIIYLITSILFFHFFPILPVDIYFNFFLILISFY